MAISRREILKVLPVALFSTGCSGNSDKNNFVDNGKVYVVEPDEKAYKDIAVAFNSDFPQGLEIAGIQEVIDHFCRQDDTLVLSSLRHDEGYSGQIVRPLDRVLLERGLIKTILDVSERHVEETPHAADINGLSVHSDSDGGYQGSLSLYDAGGDLQSYIIAIDNEILRTGLFIRNGEVAKVLAEKYGLDKATDKEGVELRKVLSKYAHVVDAGLTLQVGDLKIESDGTFIECMHEKDGRLYAHSSSGIGKFGKIPTGSHELTFYVLDKRGNRSFAIVPYKI